MPLRLSITVAPGYLELDKKELRKTMRATGSEIATATRALIRAKSGLGRTYLGTGGDRSGKRGGYRKYKYRASGPGNPPVSVTGTLSKSLKVFVYKSGEGVAIRDLAFYAVMLEGGAMGGGPGRRNIRRNWRRGQSSTIVGRREMLPRPFLSTVFDQRQASLEGRISNAIQTGLSFKKQKP